MFCGRSIIHKPPLVIPRIWSPTMSLVQDLEDITALDLEGQPVRLGDLWQEKTAVLVFVRHFG